MSLRTPRHDYGPTATPARYATPKANMLGSSIGYGGGNTPGFGSTSISTMNPNINPNMNTTMNASVGPSSGGSGPGPGPNAFDFLQHPLFADPESLHAGGLQFEGFYANVAGFKQRLDAFVEESFARIEEAKERQAALKEEQKHRIRGLEKQTEGEKKAQKDLFAAIAAEREDDAEARRVQAEKERYLHRLHTQLTEIQSELDELRRTFAQRRGERTRTNARIQAMARLNVPERLLLESRTGCRISSPGDDLIGFTFTLLCAQEPDEHAFFVLGVGKRNYLCPAVQPPLPEGTVKALLAELNASRNPFKFIKQMRRLLKARAEAGARASGTPEEAVRSLGLVDDD